MTDPLDVATQAPDPDEGQTLLATPQAKAVRTGLIDAAAECIRLAAAESFADMDPPVTAQTPLRNPWPATGEQRAAAAAASSNPGLGAAGL